MTSIVYPTLSEEIFGPPEPLESYGDDDPHFPDDAPVPSERELLWPSCLATHLGVALCEKLYGHVPRRTWLRTEELPRRLRHGSTHIYDLIEAGSLDATDFRSKDSRRGSYRVYRYSVVWWLFTREFRDADFPRTGAGHLTAEERRRIDAALKAAGSYE